MKQSPKMPAADRREATIAAFVGLAAECNPAEITTAAIADRMKLTQGAIFRHFPTKDAVMEAVMDWVASGLLRAVGGALARPGSSLAALEAAFHAHVAFVVAHPGAPRMLFGELQRAEKTATKKAAQILLKQYARRLVEVIDRGKEQGEIARAIDAPAAATLFIGAIQGLVMQSLLSGNISRLRAEAPAAFRLYRRAIASAL